MILTFVVLLWLAPFSSSMIGLECMAVMADSPTPRVYYTSGAAWEEVDATAYRDAIAYCSRELGIRVRHR